MKWKVYVGVFLLASVGATTLGLAGAHAQMAADMDRLWCIRMRNSIMRNYRAVESMRVARQAGINKLRAEHQPATKNLEAWYWKRIAVFVQQMRDLGVECRSMEIRPDPPSQVEWPRYHDRATHLKLIRIPDGQDGTQTVRRLGAMRLTSDTRSPTIPLVTGSDNA